MRDLTGDYRISFIFREQFLIPGTIPSIVAKKMLS